MKTKNITRENTAFIGDVLKFHKLFNHPVLSTPTIPLANRCTLRLNLLKEELKELEEGLINADIVEVADALADIQYVLAGAILEFGLGDKFYEIFQEVQRSNMTKACINKSQAEMTLFEYNRSEKGLTSPGFIVSYDEGKTYVVENQDGKTIKSIGYSPADIKSILYGK